MIACAFDEENTILDPAKGDEDSVYSLSVWRGQYSDGNPVVISCWKLTIEEMEMIKKTGKVWLCLLGNTMSPAHLQVQNPFQDNQIGK